MSLLAMMVYGVLCYLIGRERGAITERHSCSKRLAAEWEDGYEWAMAEPRGEVVNVSAYLATHPDTQEKQDG